MPRMIERPGDQFLLKTIPDPKTGCWIWMGPTNHRGYGEITSRRVVYRAHRWAYEQQTGEAIGNRVAHHKCENKRCVNPLHIEPMTNSAHTDLHIGLPRRSRTHCKNGHLFDTKNTHHGKTGRRICRKCRAAAKARSMARRRMDFPQEITAQ